MTPNDQRAAFIAKKMSVSCTTADDMLNFLDTVTKFLETIKQYRPDHETLVYRIESSTRVCAALSIQNIEALRRYIKGDDVCFATAHGRALAGFGYQQDNGYFQYPIHYHFMQDMQKFEVERARNFNEVVKGLEP